MERKRSKLLKIRHLGWPLTPWTQRNFNKGATWPCSSVHIMWWLHRQMVIRKRWSWVCCFSGSWRPGITYFQGKVENSVVITNTLQHYQHISARFYYSWEGRCNCLSPPSIPLELVLPAAVAQYSKTVRVQKFSLNLRYVVYSKYNLKTRYPIFTLPWAR